MSKTNNIIAAEFANSMVKAINKYAEKFKVDPNEVQVGFRLTNEMKYGIYCGYMIKEHVRINDILFLNPIYSMFKGMIPAKIEEAMGKINLEEEVKPVFVSLSKISGKKIRVVVFSNGQYERDIKIEDFL